MTKTEDIYARRNYNKYYGTWGNIKRRCYDTTNKSYQHYGGKGIKVCDRWLGRDGFKNFVDDMGKKPTDKHTLDRIDNSKNYSPENCRWADWKTQGNNKTNNKYYEIDGVKRTLSEWCALSPQKPSTIRMRLTAYGWGIERALWG